MIRYITLYITIIICLVLTPFFAHASSQVGVFVLHSDSTSRFACIEVVSATISGRDLLERSGLKPIFDSGFLVELDAEQSQSAWQSRTGDNFWYSFVFKEGAWHNVNAGAGMLKLQAGQVYGWQNHAGASILPKISFDLVCPKRIEIAPAAQISTVVENAPAQSVLSEPDKSADISNSVLKPDFKTQTASVQISPTAEPTNSPSVKGAFLPENNLRSDYSRYILIILVFLGATAGFILARRKR